MYRLFIQGEEVELSEKTRVNISRKIFDLSNLSARGVRFTNAFTLPVTSKNLRITGNPQVLSSNNKAFEQTSDYQLVDNNAVVSAGKVIVKNFDEKKGVKIQLSEGVDFWDSVAGLRLKDIKLDNFDFVFNESLKSNEVFIVVE